MKVSLEKALSFNYPNEYGFKDLLEFDKFASNVKIFHPCKIECSVNKTEGGYTFGHGCVYLINDVCNIRIKKWNGQYHIYLEDDFDNLTSYSIQNIKKGFIEPKNIGVLTTKKINDWMEYLQEVYLECKKENDKKTSVISNFLKSIEKENVKWWNDHKHGEIIKNGIKFTFKIEDGYVNQKIEIYYDVDSTIENFRKLSNNKYIKLK